MVTIKITSPQNKARIIKLTKFLIVGAINTGLTYSLYFVLQLFLFYQVAYTIAYIVGVLFSYWFNAVFVFRVPPSWVGLMLYPLVYIAQYLLSVIFLTLLVEYFRIQQQFGPLLIVALMIPATFFISRWIIESDKAR